jgi:hypothetical protein
MTVNATSHLFIKIPHRFYHYLEQKSRREKVQKSKVQKCKRADVGAGFKPAHGNNGLL